MADTETLRANTAEWFAEYQRTGDRDVRNRIVEAHRHIADYYVRSAGSITTLGTSCAGTTGLSSHTATAPKGYPFLGDSTTLRLSNALRDLIVEAARR